MYNICETRHRCICWTLGGARSKQVSMVGFKKRNKTMNLKKLALAGTALSATVFCTTVFADSAVESSNIVG